MPKPNQDTEPSTRGRALMAVWGALVLFALAVMVMNG